MTAKPGRVSSEEIETRGHIAAPPGDRPDAPGYLSESEAAEWRAIVERMPDGWFGAEVHALLAAFCQHTLTHRSLRAKAAQLQARLAPESIATLDRLLRMSDREARTMTALARSLRLTHQSRYDPATAARRVRNGGGSPSGREIWDE